MSGLPKRKNGMVAAGDVGLTQMYGNAMQAQAAKSMPTPTADPGQAAADAALAAYNARKRRPGMASQVLGVSQPTTLG